MAWNGACMVTSALYLCICCTGAQLTDENFLLHPKHVEVSLNSYSAIICTCTM